MYFFVGSLLIQILCILQTNNENQKKIEKLISEKDSLVQNVDRDQEIKVHAQVPYNQKT